MADHSKKLNESLLELFQLEIDTHTKNMLIELKNTEQQKSDSTDNLQETFSRLIKANQAITGAIKLVHVDIALVITENLHSVFNYFKEQSRSADSQSIQLITQAIELLKMIAGLPAKKIKQAESKLINSISLCCEQLQTLATTDLTETTPATNSTNPARENSTEIILTDIDSETIESVTIVSDTTETEETHYDITPTAETSTTFSTASNIDQEMFELFSIELKNSIHIISNNLLEIEEHPQDSSLLEAMMRAAHSIKGAARMIGIEAVVKLSHAMEDVFVAAQNNQINLTVNSINIIFNCTDLLKQIEETASADIRQWTESNTELLNRFIHTLQLVKNGNQTTASKNTYKSKKNMQTLNTQSPTEKSNTNSMVRVSTQRINRLVGLAGELTVSANWVHEHSKSMLSLKRTHNRMMDEINNLRQLIDNSVELTAEAKLLTDIQHKADLYKDTLNTHIVNLDNFDRRSSNLSAKINHEILASRMRPFSDITQGYKRMVRDLSQSLKKKIQLVILGNDTSVDRDILEKLDAPLNHMIRNAIDHGIELPEDRLLKGKPESGTITISASHQAGRLRIQIKDDGRGVNLETLRDKILQKKLVNQSMAEKLSKTELLDFLFLPSFSTRNEVTEVSGRGVGLDVVHSALQEVRGKLHADTQLDRGMEINMELPLSLSVIRCLLVLINNELYGFPLANIQNLYKIHPQSISVIEDKQYTTIDGKHIGLIHCAQILGQKIKSTDSKQDSAYIPVVMIGDWNTSYGVVVDKIIGERGLALRALNKKLGKIKDISAAALTDDGDPVLIFDTDDLLHNIRQIISNTNLYKVGSAKDLDKSDNKRVLIVDDSLTVREIEKKLLKSRGYLVDLAIDGVDGWNTVRNGQYDLVISDIDMPRMNGIELIKLIKNDPQLRHIPVMMVSYKDRPEDRQLGLQVGADYYLTKSSFHDDTLLNAVLDLIGEARS